MKPLARRAAALLVAFGLGGCSFTSQSALPNMRSGAALARL